MSSHLVALLFLSVWHDFKILKILLILKMILLSFNAAIALLLGVLHLLYEALCWLEAWKVVSWDSEGCVLGDVTSGLGCTVLDVEAAETTQVYVLLVLDEALLHLFHERLHYHAYFFLWHSCGDCYFVNDICFGHFFFYLLLYFNYLKSVCKDTSFLRYNKIVRAFF